jgi:two-component system, sensor histidine kinase PdtaS
VSVEFSRRDGKWDLVVSDEGKGLPANFDLKQASSLGMRVVQTLAGRLGASLEVTSSAGGARFTISGDSAALA